jgi:hypothetical protein
VAFIVQSGIISIGHTFFLILTRPTKGNKMFPYHVKTNQIGFIENDDNDDDRQTQDSTSKSNFPHHREDQSGNKEYESDPAAYLTNLFTVRNNGDKYRVKPNDYDINSNKINNIELIATAQEMGSQSAKSTKLKY